MARLFVLPADDYHNPPRKESEPLSRREFFRRSGRALAATAGATLFYTWRIEPHWIEVVRRKLPLVGLPAELAGKRLVQVSDLHAGPVVDQSYLIGAMERLETLAPDWLVLTGDFMSCYGDEEVAKALEVIREAPRATFGRFAILGNHDYGQYWCVYAAADKLSAGLESLDVRVLRNEVAEAGELQLAGMDDLWTPNFQPERVLADIASDRPSLLLCHNPDGVDRPELSQYRGWTLAGHTHGGQCKAPFLNPPINPVQNKRYVAGEYELASGGRLYINRGLGYLHRVRFNARPEITVFTLERA
jgi:predicted MPP superfamily phosphohydrolase